MNKLRKPVPVNPPPTPPKSRTMALAQTAAQMVAAPGSTAAANYHATTIRSLAVESQSSSHLKSLPTPALLPKTAQEQYWAARALTAETLLSAKVAHQHELKSLNSEADAKRVHELEILRKAHESRQSRLETLVVTLLVLLLALSIAFVYSVHANSKERSRRKSSVHFTIPILSPFASVVEHEMSVIGPRLLTAFAAILAICLYGCFRYWLTHRKAR